MIPFDFVPLWAMTLIIGALLLGGCELGYRLGRRKVGAERGDQAHVLSAMLALLGLLIGFTFSTVVNRHELRRNLVVEEANAIRTEYLRSEMTPEPYRSRLEDGLRRYTDARLALADAGEDKAALARAEALADSLQQVLWAATVEAVPTVQPAAISSLVAGDMNTIFDVTNKRRSAYSARLPTVAVGVLVVYAFVASVMLGFVSGSGKQRSRVASETMLLLMTIALGLILDLDRSYKGTIRISQEPLVNLREFMRHH